MKPAFGLPPEAIAALNGVFAKYPAIEQVVLYGSRAKGNEKPGSDIDLTLIAPTLGLSDLLKIENEIDDLLLPYKVDLSLRHLIENKDLLDHIARVGLPFR
jgi:predicted nucleotidyltransferase